VDRAAWFALDEARRRILHSQEPFLDRLVAAEEDGNGPT
jgi:predicted NUDIX family NTP pyrophosphohydrolase